LSEADRELVRAIALRTKAENARETQAIVERLALARVEARTLADRLAADPAVKRVLFFGSASTGRRFRHAFRTLYQTELDPCRVQNLNDTLPELISEFLSFHERYIAILALLAEEIEST
jgi:hypothetical protein